MEMNPYAPPQAYLYLDNQGSDAESIRLEHLKTEGRMKFLGAMTALVGCALLMKMINEPGEFVSYNSPAVELTIAVLSVVQFIFGLLLYKLKPWIRLPMSALSLLCVLEFPVGTTASIYILYLLNGKRGKLVLSPDYKAIRDATPHIKRKTSRVILITFAVLVLLLAALFLYAQLM